MAGEGHAGAGQLPFITKRGGWNPNGGELAQVEQGGQPLGIELVGLVDVAHHDFGLGGVGQQGKAAGVFDLVDNPIPVADRFQGDRRAFRELGEKGRNGPWCVAKPPLLNERSTLVQNSKDGEVFVRIAADRIIEMNHAAPPVLDREPDTPSLVGGAVLSSNHLAGSDRGCWARLA